MRREDALKFDRAVAHSDCWFAAVHFCFLSSSLRRSECEVLVLENTLVLLLRSALRLQSSGGESSGGGDVALWT